MPFVYVVYESGECPPECEGIPRNDRMTTDGKWVELNCDLDDGTIETLKRRGVAVLGPDEMREEIRFASIVYPSVWEEREDG